MRGGIRSEFGGVALASVAGWGWGHGFGCRPHRGDSRHCRADDLSEWESVRAEAQRAEAQFEQILGSGSNIRIIAARELETSDREVGREGGRPSCQMAEDGDSS